MRLVSMLVCLGLAGAGVADVGFAKDAPSGALVEMFEEQREAIVAGFAEGGIYAETSVRDRRRVLDALDRLQSNVSGTASIKDLDADVKVAVFNDQELINGILTEAREESREVCEFAAPVGTRFKTSICYTVAEWNRIRQQSLRYNEATRSDLVGPGL